MSDILTSGKTFEGTWEEVARHGAELAGRKVRLTVIDEPPIALDQALAPIIADAERLSQLLPPVAPTLTEDDWSEGVVEKYRRQGFSL